VLLRPSSVFDCSTQRQQDKRTNVPIGDQLKLTMVSRAVSDGLFVNVVAVCRCSGGVLTPGAAFANTGLLQRLQNRGIQFTVVEKVDG